MQAYAIFNGFILINLDIYLATHWLMQSIRAELGVQPFFFSPLFKKLSVARQYGYVILIVTSSAIVLIGAFEKA